MKPLKHHEIRGNWATLLLPIQSDDSIDYSLLSEQIDRFIEFKVSGIYSNGTAGEFYNQTEQEFDKISELLAEKCNKADMPFQIGVSHMSPILSLGRLQRAVQLKPGAVQVILPDWAPTCFEENVVFMQRMAEQAGDIGLVLYNPPHAKRHLPPADIIKLKQHLPSLIGVKTAGGDATWYQEMQSIMSELSVFVPGHKLAGGFQQGAHGAYSNAACLNPLAAQLWYDQMRVNIDEALLLEKRIVTFFDDYIRPYITKQQYSNQAVDKLLACIGNWTPISPRLRWPYKSVPEQDAKKIRKAGKALLPEFLQN